MSYSALNIESFYHSVQSVSANDSTRMITRKLTSLPAGPFTPGQPEPTCFALYADDCLLHFDADQLTPKQRDDHEANIVLTAMLQVALTYMGQRNDHAALHDEFLKEPWADTLAFYNELFTTLFGDVIGLEHYHYFPRDGFYETLAEISLPVKSLSLYMMSGSNLPLHQDRSAWELSKKLNSKMHFSATATAKGLPIPHTFVCKKRELAANGAQFFAQHPQGVMLKIQGLAGARNVTHVSTVAQAQQYLAEFDDNLDVLLQERLDTSKFTEMTVDLAISETVISITNVRKILFANGLWVGNYISDELTLSNRQREVCLQVGEYVRELGFSGPRSMNCGIDFFVRNDDIVLIEINARWTGGLFPTQLIKRLGVEHEPSVAFIDVITPDALDVYRHFVSEHAPTTSLNQHGFRLVPMGFSPFPQALDGINRIYVWQLVIGDFDAFKTHKQRYIGRNELPSADLIAL